MPPEEFWKKHARSTAARVNFAWWLKSFIPWFLTSGVVGIITLLLLRRNRWSETPFWWCFTGFLLLGAIVSAWQLKRRWFSENDALVRLESVLGLNNRLSAALAGVGAWPSPPPPDSAPPDAHLAWSPRESLLPILGVLLLLGASAWIPIPDALLPTFADQIEKPTSIQQVENWLEELKKAEQLDQEKVKAMMEQLSDLTRRSPTEWYSQSNLEAGDNLRAQAAQSLRELHREVGVAEEVAATLAQQQRLGMDPQMAQELAKQLGAAMEALESGKMGLSKEMMEQLKHLDPTKLQQQLTPEQMQQLQENLQKSQALAESLPGLENMKFDGLGDGEGEEGEGEGDEGEPGMMKISRGRGDAPLTLRQRESQLGTEKIESISNEDLSRALPGETLAITSSKPEGESVDFQSSARGGTAVDPGQGGEAVWKDNLMPSEREALRPYFK